MNCPTCSTEINGINAEIAESKLIYCPDGYGSIYSDFLGLATLVPKSGRTEVGYVAGRTTYLVLPCRCQVASIKNIKDNIFAITGRTPAGEVVTVTGSIKFSNVNAVES